MRAALALASLALVVTGAAGCDSDGGGDGAKQKETSTADFCQAFDDFQVALADVDPSDPKAAIRKLKDEATKLANAGTPSDIPEDAGHGFDVVLDAIDSIPDDASLDDLAKVQGTLSDDDKAASDAFEDYLKKACPDLD